MNNLITPAAPLVALRAPRTTWQELLDFGDLPFHVGIAIQWQMLRTGAFAFNVHLGGEDAALVQEIATAFELDMEVIESSVVQIERMRAKAKECGGNYGAWLLKFCDTWERDLLNGLLYDAVEVEI